jgi:hypothetical protein
MGMDMNAHQRRHEMWLVSVEYKQTFDCFRPLTSVGCLRPFSFKAVR